MARQRATSEIKTGVRVNARSTNEFSDFIVAMYEAGSRNTIFGVGDIGVGKSEAPRRAAKIIAEKRGLTFYEFAQNRPIPDNAFVLVDLRLTDLEPVDLSGLPREDPEDPNTVIFKVQRFVKALAEHPGILFLDELTNENRPNMKASSYKILLDRTIGQVKLHDDALVVAAGNRPDDAVGLAEAFSAPQANRLIIVDIRAPTVEEWMQYMDARFTVDKEVIKNGKKVVEKVADWDRRVAAFLKSSPGSFSQSPKEAYTLENFGTPRAWTQIAQVSHKLDDKTLEIFAEGKVGMGEGIHFIQFTNIKLEPFEYYVKNPKNWETLQNLKEPLAAQYLLSVQIANKLADDPEVDGLMDYIANASGDFIGKTAEKLFNRFKDLILKAGGRMLMVDTSAENAPAIRFFNKMGFGVPMPHVYMTMNLDADLHRMKKKAGANGGRAGLYGHDTIDPGPRRKVKQK